MKKLNFWCRELFEIADTTAILPAVPAAPAEKPRGSKSKRAIEDPHVPATTTATATATGSTAKKTSSSPEDDIKCELCEDAEHAATAFCVQCSKYFCAGSQRGHKKPRLSSGHEFVAVEKALKEKMRAVPFVEGERQPHGEVEARPLVYRRDYREVGDKPAIRFGSFGSGEGQFGVPCSVACNSRERLSLLIPTTIAFRCLIEMASSCLSLDHRDRERASLILHKV